MGSVKNAQCGYLVRNKFMLCFPERKNMSFKGWERVKIITSDNQQVEALAPLIISASRSTDIPAFYAQWFIDRLKRGYVRWINPFNGKSTFVSFEKVRLIAFWSKNPSPIIPLLDELDRRGIYYLFQVTLNDYEKEALEKKVPPLENRIKTFKTLSERAGKRKVMWRFDPLILSDKISPEILCERIGRIGDEIHSYTERLTLSFLSLYTSVYRNLRKAAIKVRQFSPEDIDYIGGYLVKKNKEWGLNILSCAEKTDLSRFGIGHGSCIDPMLIGDLFGDDPVLGDFLGLEKRNDLFGNETVYRKKLKDPGQRDLCGCIASKDIGRYNTCPHLCTYCYANSYPGKVIEQYKSRQEFGDSI